MWACALGGHGIQPLTLRLNDPLGCIRPFIPDLVTTVRTDALPSVLVVERSGLGGCARREPEPVDGLLAEPLDHCGMQPGSMASALCSWPDEQRPDIAGLGDAYGECLNPSSFFDDPPAARVFNRRTDLFIRDAAGRQGVLGH